jgi:quinoprotein glucose dehydrogenase
MYNRDYASTRYSPLNQINTTNVSQLIRAWSLQLREPNINIGPASSSEVFQQVTPIVVNGIMYLPAGNRVLAVEPDTGRQIWRFDVKSGLASFRGVAYWPGDEKLPPRIFFTNQRKLVALNAGTGTLDNTFGDNGEIELKIPYSGVPVVYKNVILMGSNFFGPGERHIGPQLETFYGEPGNTHGYDARDGKMLWEFHTIPREGEPGNETWLDGSWKKPRTGNNVWAFSLTVDEERGTLYLPVSSAGANFYGADRPGNNAYSNSTVAIDAMTGKLKWYFQHIHHELWDYNLPSSPSLIDIVKDGKTIPALAQVGKHAYMFILNRETGEPVFGVEERPVARGNAPNEWYSPTQPIPLKPPAIARDSVKLEDLVTAQDTAPEHAQACRELWDRVKFQNSGPYTPFPLRSEGAPPAVIFPGITGGVNWNGTAVDPALGYIFVNSKDSAGTGWIQPNSRYSAETADRELPYVWVSGPSFSASAKTADGRTLGPWPCQKPPWARLIAVNANTGDFAWEVPLGVNETLPEGKRNVGSPGSGGPIATAGGLVFISGTGDRRFRAFDSRTGKELWAASLDFNATAVPMTYAKNGKQYVAIVAASGRSTTAQNTESLVVYTLP